MGALRDIIILVPRDQSQSGRWCWSQDAQSSKDNGTRDEGTTENRHHGVDKGKARTWTAVVDPGLVLEAWPIQNHTLALVVGFG